MPPATSTGASTDTFKDKWNTYRSVTKMMLLPTLAGCGGIGVIYLLMVLLFSVL